MPTAPRRPCVHPGCPRLQSQRGRCEQHARQYEQQRVTSTKRGYDYAWQRTSKAAIAAAPWCVVCLTTGTPDNPLTGDHLTPISQGGTTNDGIRVVCRRHNSARRDRPI